MDQKIDFVSVDESFDELLEEAKDKIKNCPAPVYILSSEMMMFRKFGWSDQKLQEITTTLKFPKKVFDCRNFKSIVTHFFLFYFNGEIDENWTVQSTVFSAISLLNIPDFKRNEVYKRIFDEEYMETEEIKPFYDWAGKTSCVPLDEFYIFTDNNLFNFEIQDTVLSWNENLNRITEKQAKLIRLAAFLALTLCRISARNHILLMGAFNSNEYRQNLSDYVGWTTEKPFLIPSRDCIIRCYDLMDVLNPMYAIVVGKWIQIQENKSPQPEDKLVQALLYKSLLQGTEGFGIEVIKMLESVLIYIQKSFQEMMEIICIIEPNITKFSDWRALINFHRKFLDKDNPQYSFPWARLIDSAFLRECTLDENSFVAATLATILEFKVGAITWKAFWMLIRPELTRRGFILGQMIHEILMDTDPDMEGERRQLQKHEGVIIKRTSQDSDELI